jgi:hypothetical protein
MTWKNLGTKIVPHATKKVKIPVKHIHMKGAEKKRWNLPWE